jgi:hypothetical protein
MIPLLYPQRNKLREIGPTEIPTRKLCTTPLKTQCKRQKASNSSHVTTEEMPIIFFNIDFKEFNKEEQRSLG